MKEKESVQDRKERHLTVCLDRPEAVTAGRENDFRKIRFCHRALPETDARGIRLKVSFLGYDLSFPFFISPMTGGSPEGLHLNVLLAEAANTCRVPFCCGSIRPFLERKSPARDFFFKPLLPDVPFILNIGAVQIRELGDEQLGEAVKMLEADALGVHLNSGQELMQKGGDRDFSGLLKTIERIGKKISPRPLIVKETGFGILPREGKKLLEAGAAYLDVAGAGGTNWILVEALRGRAGEGESGEAFRESFADWGWSTAALLGAYREIPLFQGRVLASGGLRNGMDLAKSLALGARLGGMALPVIRKVHRDGKEAVIRTLREYRKILGMTLVLSGKKTPEEFRKTSLFLEPALREKIAFLIEDYGRGL